MLRRLASLRLWLVAAMVGAAAVGVVASRFVLADLGKRSERSKDQHKAQLVADAIAGRAAAGATTPQLRLMQSVLANDQILVYRRGRLVFSGVLPRRTGELELTAEAPFDGGRVVLRDFESPSGFAPAGLLTLVVAAVAALVILAAAATATVLVAAVRQPIERAVSAARRVAGGDFGARIGAGGPEELVELGRAFDDMAARLEAGDQQQRRFLADLAHEIATPLNIVSGYALALAGGEIDERDELDEAARVVRDETERLQSLLQRLRQLVHLDLVERGRDERVDLRSLLRRLEHRFLPAAREAAIELEVRGGGSVRTDPRLVETVVDNFVSNAIRYTPAGGRVTVECHRRRRGVVIAVRDTGIGIAPEHQRRVFDRFYRVDEARDRDSGGSGIGLALAQRAARALGGRLELESAVGRGTEFRLVLPRAAAEPAGPATAGSAPAGSRSA